MSPGYSIWDPQVADWKPYKNKSVGWAFEEKMWGGGAIREKNKLLAMSLNLKHNTVGALMLRHSSNYVSQ